VNLRPLLTDQEEADLLKNLLTDETDFISAELLALHYKSQLKTKGIPIDETRTD